MKNIAYLFQRPVDDAVITFGFNKNDDDVDKILNLGIYGTATSSPDWWHIGTDYDYTTTDPESWIVYSVANGVVEEVGIDGDGVKDGYGNYIVIKHTLPDGSFIYSFYAHLADEPSLLENDPVKIGEDIGLIGNTGTVTEFHLHFEMREVNNFTDGGPESGSYDTKEQIDSGIESGNLFDPDQFIFAHDTTKEVLADYPAKDSRTIPEDSVPDVARDNGPNSNAFENSSFETSDFSGWTVSGLAEVATSFDADGENGPAFDGDATATDGDYFAVLESGGNMTTSEIESFLGLASGSLDATSSGVPTTGTAILTEVNMKKSGDLSFDFYFDAGDYEPYNDFAFLTIDGVLIAFGDVRDVGDYGDSGWLNTSTEDWLNPDDFSLDKGTHEIGFGIIDVGDDILSSALYLDNFEIA